MRMTACEQVGLKEATTAFKKGDIPAIAYHENVLKKAFGKKLHEMLPHILKALPPDRAAALKAVIEVCIVRSTHKSLQRSVGRATSPQDLHLFLPSDGRSFMVPR